MIEDKYKIKEVVFSDERRLTDGSKSYTITVIFENGRESTVRKKKDEKNDIELGVLYAYLQGCVNLSKIKARKILLNRTFFSVRKIYLCTFFALKNDMSVDEAEEYIKSLVVA